VAIALLRRRAALEPVRTGVWALGDDGDVRAPASSAPGLRDRARGALVGAFVGDALGLPYEGQPGDAVPDPVEMRDGRAPAGSYSDDTQMMIALAESLVRCGRIDEDDLASSFGAHFDPQRGYGSGTRTVITLWASGMPITEAAERLFDGEGSPRNGAAMRVAPIGVRFRGNQRRVIEEARRSAALTHRHPEGIDGAVVQAVAVAAALHGRDALVAASAAASTPRMRLRLDDLAGRAADGLSLRTLTGRERLVPVTAVGSVPVAIVVGSRSRTFQEAVSAAVRCGGDTDTVAAMAGAIAGARFGASAIPARWYRALEDTGGEVAHVENLAIALVRAAQRDG
jgi:poly(ADP-ribose) glycohydrolase ARH3